jgi:hypothetical protein
MGGREADKVQASAMMKRMLDRVVATLPDQQIYALHQAVAGQSKHPAILALDDLLRTKYRDTIILYEAAMDQ